MTSFCVSKESTHVSGCCKLVLSSNQPDSPMPLMKKGINMVSQQMLTFALKAEY
jgi:hypothetical protein